MTAGSHHSCGIRTDNTIDCWGKSTSGEADAPPGTFTQVTAGSHHSCGIRADNTVLCWGDNYYGQTDAPSGIFTQVSVGSGHSCGIRADNTIDCWGTNRDRAPLRDLHPDSRWMGAFVWDKNRPNHHLLEQHQTTPQGRNLATPNLNHPPDPGDPTSPHPPCKGSSG